MFQYHFVLPRPPRRLQNETTLWLIAVLISVVLHGLLFWSKMSGPFASSPEKQMRKVTRIDFHREVPPTLPAPPPPSMPVPVREVVKMPPPPVVPQPRPAVKKSEPVMQPQAPPRPPEAIEIPENVTSTEEAVAMPQLPRALPTPLPDEARQRFLEKLFAHIEAHKYYPGVARRRRLQGKVQVSFTMLANGTYRDLRIGGGPKLLQAAAEKSLKRSLPLPLPKGEVAMPLELSFKIDFRLR